MPKSVKGVMDEWRSGILHSGSKQGPVVKNRKQALAIALAEQRQGTKGASHTRYELQQARRDTLPRKQKP